MACPISCAATCQTMVPTVLMQALRPLSASTCTGSYILRCPRATSCCHPRVLCSCTKKCRCHNPVHLRCQVARALLPRRRRHGVEVYLDALRRAHLRPALTQRMAGACLIWPRMPHGAAVVIFPGLLTANHAQRLQGRATQQGEGIQMSK